MQAMFPWYYYATNSSNNMVGQSPQSKLRSQRFQGARLYEPTSLMTRAMLRRPGTIAAVASLSASEASAVLLRNTFRLQRHNIALNGCKFYPRYPQIDSCLERLGACTNVQLASLQISDKDSIPAGFLQVRCRSADVALCTSLFIIATLMHWDFRSTLSTYSALSQAREYMVPHNRQFHNYQDRDSASPRTCMTSDLTPATNTQTRIHNPLEPRAVCKSET